MPKHCKQNISGNVHKFAAQSHSLDDSPTLVSQLERTFLTLPIGKIQFYDKNPRRQENPNYSKIKESIAKDGLNQPLVISRRPQQDHFVVYKGGNTRLKAVKELYQETGNYKFRFVDCCFVPWSGFESDAIIGHLQENEMRKSLCFIDKAHGIKTAIEHLQCEATDDKEMSLRDCLAKLTERGYSITLSSLSIMCYAAESIEPHLAPKICTLMGRPQMQKLRRLQKAFVNVGLEFDKSEQQTIRMFNETLKKYSETEWDFKFFRRSLEASLTRHVKTSIQDIALRLDGYLQLHPKPLHDSFESVHRVLEKEEKRQKLICARTKIVPNEHEADKDAQNKGTLNSQCITQSHPKPITSGSAMSNEPNSANKAATKNISKNSSTDATQNSDFNPDLGALRCNAFALASKLGKRFGFYVNPDTDRRIIINTGNWGIGFLVTDYPPAVAPLDSSETAIRDVLWWLLVEYSDLRWASECARPLIAKLIKGTDLMHFIKSGDAKSMISHAKGKMRCTVPHIGLISFCLRQLEDESWTQLREITEIYRNIHQLANRSNVNLFATHDQGEAKLWQSIRKLN